MKNPAQAYREAKNSHAITPNQTALELMGYAACRMKSETKARYAYRRLRDRAQAAVASACLQVGIDLR